MFSGSLRSVSCVYVFLIFCFGSFQEITCQTNITGSLFLNEPLNPGDTVTIKGHFKKDATSSTVDFQNVDCNWARHELDNCIDALSVQFNFVKNRIIRGTYDNFAWKIDNEWTSADFPFTFNDGKSFVLNIIIHENYFTIGINGHEYKEYPYEFQHPLSEITYIETHGGLIVHSMSIE